MNEPIRSRESICREADLAAQRFVEYGAEQPNPELEGSAAFDWWATHYARMKAFYLDEEASA